MTIFPACQYSDLPAYLDRRQPFRENCSRVILLAQDLLAGLIDQQPFGILFTAATPSWKLVALP